MPCNRAGPWSGVHRSIRVTVQCYDLFVNLHHGLPYFLVGQPMDGGLHSRRVVMLQRKQTLFLLLAALLLLATWLFPIASYERAGSSFQLRSTGLFTAEGVPVSDVELKVPFHLVLSVLAVGMVVAIFLYGNRHRQMRFIRGSYLILLAVIAFQFIVDRSVTSYLAQGGMVETRYGLTFILPIVALVLAFLAERAVKADEALVRSMDRLR